MKIKVVDRRSRRSSAFGCIGRKKVRNNLCLRSVSPPVDSTLRHRARLLLSTDIKCILGKGEFQNITAVDIHPTNHFDKNPSCDSSQSAIWQCLCLCVSTSWTSRIGALHPPTLLPTEQNTGWKASKATFCDDKKSIKRGDCSSM